MTHLKPVLLTQILLSIVTVAAVSAQINSQTFTVAEKLYAQKRYVEAEPILRQCLKNKQDRCASLYLLANILVLQNHLDEARLLYKQSNDAGPDTRPGQYSALALQQLSDRNTAKVDRNLVETKSSSAGISDLPMSAERKRLLGFQKEKLETIQGDYKRDLAKLNSEEEEKILYAPSNQAGFRNPAYNITQDLAVAQIKGDYAVLKKKLRDFYDRKESVVNAEFEKRLSELNK